MEWDLPKQWNVQLQQMADLFHGRRGGRGSQDCYLALPRCSCSPFSIPKSNSFLRIQKFLHGAIENYLQDRLGPEILTLYLPPAVDRSSQFYT